MRVKELQESFDLFNGRRVERQPKIDHATMGMPPVENQIAEVPIIGSEDPIFCHGQGKNLVVRDGCG